MDNRASGYSILQVLISFLFLGLLSVAIFKLNQKNITIAQSSGYAFAAFSITDNVKTILSDGPSCIDSLKNIDLSQDHNIKRVSLRRDAQAFSYESGRHYGGGLVSIVSMYIEENDTFNRKNGHGLYHILFREVDGDDQFSLSFPIHLTVSEKDKVTSCYTLGGTLVANRLQQEGGWIRKENVVSTRANVSLGSVSAQSTLNLPRGLRLSQERSFGDVSCESQGVIDYNKKFGLVYCSAQKVWRKVMDAPRKKDIVTIRLKGKRPGISKSLTTEDKFFYCSVKNPRSQVVSCFVSKVKGQSELKSHWNLVYEPGRRQKGECLFICSK